LKTTKDSNWPDTSFSNPLNLLGDILCKIRDRREEIIKITLLVKAIVKRRIYYHSQTKFVYWEINV